MRFNIKLENISGYILIIAGLCLFIYGIILIFSISQGLTVPIDIFNTNQEINDINPPIDNNQYNTSNTNTSFEQILTPLYPIFNLLIWVSLIFFIIISGLKTIRIGLKMLITSIEFDEITKNELEDIKNISPLPKQKIKNPY